MSKHYIYNYRYVFMYVFINTYIYIHNILYCENIIHTLMCAYVYIYIYIYICTSVCFPCLLMFYIYIYIAKVHLISIFLNMGHKLNLDMKWFSWQIWKKLVSYSKRLTLFLCTNEMKYILWKQIFVFSLISHNIPSAAKYHLPPVVADFAKRISCAI